MEKNLVLALTTAVLWILGKLEVSIGGTEVPAISGVQAFLLFFSLYAFTGGYHTLWRIHKTFKRDSLAAVRYLKILFHLKRAKLNNISVPEVFMKNVKKHPDKVALIFEGRGWTFTEIDDYSNRVANYLKTFKLHKGDTVALYMLNRPEYVATWLGCSKIGLITALINFNLREATLVRSINVVDSKLIICDEELEECLSAVKDELESLPILMSGLKDMAPKISGATNMDLELKNADNSVPNEMFDVNFGDKLVYIYTSGTTGMPKAAIIRHGRYMFFSAAIHFIMGFGENEVLYNPLPLYHSAGGMIGVGQVLLHGNCAVIRKKFSASNYWPECKKYGCTVGQYVGELCRYLLNQPPRPEDKEHKVRLMFGNGVRTQIWEQFTERFNMPCIAEVYGATEGIANIVNFEGKIGACGFIPPFARYFYPVSIIKVDEATGEPVRNENGLCIPCQPGEPGECIGQICTNDPVRDFDGYADKDASQKKIVRDVFKKGDSAFLSGDILVMDELGYVYFKDRTGDTFRWRGENVSTTEVEGVISQVSGDKDVVVFGVEIPGVEGKAGMAVVVDPEDTLDMKELYFGLKKLLPGYAVPLLVRIVKEIQATGTFKLKKAEKQKEGFDIHAIKDKLFFLDSSQQEYVPLTEELYNKIQSEQIRL